MARDTLKTLQAEHEDPRTVLSSERHRRPEVKTRAELLAKIDQGLLPHAKWKESVFYPAFTERAERGGLKTHAEAIDDHLHICDAAQHLLLGLYGDQDEAAAREEEARIRGHDADLIRVVRLCDGPTVADVGRTPSRRRNCAVD